MATRGRKKKYPGLLELGVGEDHLVPYPASISRNEFQKSVLTAAKRYGDQAGMRFTTRRVGTALKVIRIE